MNQIEDLNGAILMSKGDYATAGHQPQKVWVLDWELTLIRKK